MRTKAILLALASAGLLAACGSPSPEDLRQRISGWDTTNLCWSYGYEHGSGDYTRELIRAELERRGVARAEQWSAIEAGTVRPGMTICEALASWGRNSDLNYVGGEGQFLQQLSTTLYKWDSPFRWAYVQRGIVTQAGSSVEQYNRLLVWMVLDPHAPPPDPQG